MKYFFHDGSLLVPQHEASASDLNEMISMARKAAANAMKKAGASHGVYAVKHYDPEGRAPLEVDIYCPAVLLDDAEFQQRTENQAKDSPGCYILAVHAR